MITRYASLRQGLVGAWCPSLGASGYRLIDRSGNNNHGTLTNMDPGTDWIPSGGKLALDFDGTDDYVAFQPPTATVSILTVCGWSNQVTSLPQYFPLVHTRQAGFAAGVFRSGTAGNVLTSMWNGTIQEFNAATALGIPSVGVWFFWAMVVNNSTLTTWLNDNSFSLSITPTSYNIGVQWQLARDTFSTRYSNVLIDDVRMYSRALTPSEIRLLYTGGRGVGLMPERIKHRRKTSAAASNRRRRILCGASQ